MESCHLTSSMFLSTSRMNLAVRLRESFVTFILYFASISLSLSYSSITFLSSSATKSFQFVLSSKYDSSFFLSFFWFSSFEFRNKRLNEKNQMKNWNVPFRRFQTDIIRVSIIVIFNLRFPLIGQIYKKRSNVEFMF